MAPEASNDLYPHYFKGTGYDRRENETSIRDLPSTATRSDLIAEAMSAGIGGG